MGKAYTTELEQEVDHLVNENRTLKRQFEESLLPFDEIKRFKSSFFAQLKKAAQDHLFVPAKHTLQRTLTAPF
ncbi:Basic region leucine zipper [Musa troglodytarum]|uniref:Basic region leucine zipper n=1 Tax=Musa troglodytarum TaxID=320322 RepID=A0A9E7HLT2_9LILI|nr:Basic region leucine zipper [Musa troglodytarum]